MFLVINKVIRASADNYAQHSQNLHEDGLVSIHFLVLPQIKTN